MHQKLLEFPSDPSLAEQMKRQAVLQICTADLNL